jgi:hypothetical protein
VVFTPRAGDRLRMELRAGRQVLITVPIEVR